MYDDLTESSKTRVTIFPCVLEEWFHRNDYFFFETRTINPSIFKRISFSSSPSYIINHVIIVAITRATQA